MNYNTKMHLLTARQFERIHGKMEDYIGIDGNTVLHVFVPTNHDCPYIGIRYKDGSLYVYGCRVDRKVTEDELLHYMSIT
jgi:hypothetical protein